MLDAIPAKIVFPLITVSILDMIHPSLVNQCIPQGFGVAIIKPLFIHSAMNWPK